MNEEQLKLNSQVRQPRNPAIDLQGKFKKNWINILNDNNFLHIFKTVFNGYDA